MAAAANNTFVLQHTQQGVRLSDQSGRPLPLEALLAETIPQKPGEADQAYKERFQNAVRARKELSVRIHDKAKRDAGTRPLSLDEQVNLSMRVCELAAKTCSLPGCSLGINADGTTLRKCARCQEAMYCSRAHQKAHWKLHKPHCVQIQPE